MHSYQAGSINSPKLLSNITVESEPYISQVRCLFVEYAASLNIDLTFQNFSQELATLPGAYARPDGCIILAINQDETSALGCVALRALSDTICEMKRLYVSPGARRQQIGERLINQLIEEARQIGYKKMRLDTLNTMTSAQQLYKRLGFVDIPAYYDNPFTNTLYMERHL